VVGSPFPRKLRTGLLVALVTGILAVIAVRYRPERSPEPQIEAGGAIGLLEDLELRFFDVMTRRHARHEPASEQILLVRIDDESVSRGRELAGPWPWSRATLGRLVEELGLLGAKLVVLDEPLAEPAVDPQQDRQLAQSVQKAGNVVLGFGFSPVLEEEPYKPGRWAAKAGSHPTRLEALLAAAPLLAAGASPYLVASGEGFDLWIGGYRDRSTALEAAKALQLDARDLPVRELEARETLDRVTRELVFAERAAVHSGAALPANFRALQPPVAELVAVASGFGNTELTVDPDGVVRSTRHLIKHEGRVYPSLSLAAQLALDSERDVAMAGGLMRAGNRAVPVQRDATALMRFYGRAGGGRIDEPYPSIPVLAVLKSISRREAGRAIDRQLAERVMDKIVFISREVGPLPPVAATPIGKATPVATIHATALDNLMRGDGLARASIDYDSLVALIMTALGALLAVGLMRSSRMRRTVLFEGIASLIIGGAFAAFVAHSWKEGVWVGAAIPLLAFVATITVTTAISFADEVKVGGLIRDALGRGTHPATIERLLRNPHHLSLEGEQREMSALVLDVQGFSEISRSMRPRELVRMMKELFTEVSDVVVANRGQIDKLVGDSVLAYWGAPLPNHRHALDACRCALQARDLLARRKNSWKQRYGVDVIVSCGVCTADLVVGDLGAGGDCPRVNFTVIGDGVGIARRLESENRHWGTRILVSEGTFEAVREQVEAREIDLMRVRGRQRPARVFELLALKNGLSKEKRALVAEFERALVAYRRRDFGEALGILEPLAQRWPEDRPTQVYLERCRSYLRSPPGDEWDGVFEAAA
jgi:adenylate cyclase